MYVTTLQALTLQLERLTVECSQRRKVLDNELTETLSAQVGLIKILIFNMDVHKSTYVHRRCCLLFVWQLELDKAAQDFNRIHNERQELIKQWENTIEQMQKRDGDIDNCALVKYLFGLCHIQLSVFLLYLTYFNV